MKYLGIQVPYRHMGIAIINTHIMNDCLLVKWIRKITQGSDETWFQISQGKIHVRGIFFQSKDSDGSQFWRGLHKVKHMFKCGAQHKIVDGRTASFWDDYWLKEIPSD